MQEPATGRGPSPDKTRRVVQIAFTSFQETEMFVDAYAPTVSPLDVALEHALAQLERELVHRLDAVERVAVTRVLAELGEEWACHAEPTRGRGW